MMDDELYGGGGVMSFGKVPCTPVTGTYGAYYDDVFGDVERISSSGSSDDQSERRFKLKSINKTNSRNNCSAVERRDVYTDPYISFLQDKQHEILGALHEEIRILKHENADLKFQIHVILHHSGPTLENPKDCTFRNTLTLTSPDCYKDRNRGIERARNRTLELELESATKMIEELKWVQNHYETKIRVQEVKIEDLERQLNLSNGETIKVVPIQVTPSMYQTSKLLSSPNQYAKPSRQRSSSVTQQRELTSRRNSLQSMLPDDYKQAVATLPPILKSPQSDAAIVALRNTMSTAPSTLGVLKNQCDPLPLKPRKPSLMHSNPSLVRNRNNTQAIFGETMPPQHNGDAQFYFSK
ncbi:unnamed protein product [Orchesella dallaii]|uniref:CCDC92/74 N-terminal domain-containing protein n=1 Tax=Orchesella dallaii TaxID=48710 RepID=A0ABP1PN36_9HEXA